jgi:hypothetical protein
LVGIYPQNSLEFNTVLSGMVAFGDSFLSTIQQHAFENGSISEEFNRYLLIFYHSFSDMMDTVSEPGI